MHKNKKARLHKKFLKNNARYYKYINNTFLFENKENLINFKHTIALLNEYKPELKNKTIDLFSTKVFWWDYCYIANFYIFLHENGLIKLEKDDLKALIKAADDEFYLTLKQENDFWKNILKIIFKTSKKANYNTQLIILTFFKETAKSYNKYGHTVDNYLIARSIYLFIHHIEKGSKFKVIKEKFDLRCWWD